MSKENCPCPMHDLPEELGRNIEKYAYAVWRDDENQTVEFKVSDLAKLIESEVTKALDKLTKMLDKAQAQSGKGSRCKWSRDNESKRESDSRTSGFKAGMIHAKDCIHTLTKESK